MNKIKQIIFSIIIALVGSSVLSGCSSNNIVDQLVSDVQILNNKVEQISNEMNETRSDIQIVKDEAVRANQRLDNLITSYKK